jgi:hypothetical protein
VFYFIDALRMIDKKYLREFFPNTLQSHLERSSAHAGRPLNRKDLE